jgi:hypothetical protein
LQEALGFILSTAKERKTERGQTQARLTDMDSVDKAKQVRKELSTSKL